ncbi:52 kDa repressor of the inhibitor of the protein kinase-like [Adelges cooleyi]|uniref:52 kDa repressor of the inhibitor of the protein kinase-like n=1 Tax=Adelges cooleyi TaxID=133065 RepID=UPI00217FD08B|nr:52 kDa repressor of the inhibitor of the protein kinase-like [Adelges cooleyi]
MVDKPNHTSNNSSMKGQSTDLERTVPSLSNVFQDEDTGASETKQAASSVEVSSPVIKHILDSNKNIDLFNALKQVTQVVSVLNTIRENVDLKFNDIYKDAQGIAIKLNVEPKIPRTCSNQKNRSNVPFNNIEDFYKKTIFIPYLDDLIMALNERFFPHNETIISLQFVLPRIIVEKPFFNLKKAVEFYKSDLPGLNDIIEAEYEIWQAKWKNIEENLRPATAIEALRACDRLMYPNIFELLKILAIIPVSTATAERSFSTLRRLKTYLRNTTSESRLVGLALLSIHRDIDVNDDMVLDKFANSGKERNLNLI